MIIQQDLLSFGENVPPLLWAILGAPSLEVSALSKTFKPLMTDQKKLEITEALVV